MNEPIRELEAYFAGDASDEQIRIMEAWINAEPANARAFMQQLHFREVVGQYLREQADQSRVAFAELARVEGQNNELPLIHLDATALTKQKYVSALSYVLRHTFTPKRLIAGGIAAALLLAAVLTIALMTGPDPEQQVAERPNSPEHVEPEAPALRPTVATLTAQYDAVWDAASAEGALAPGSPLRAGDRLTLTQGFAEITTNDGAIAILEAPATIELINNNNAIRLHTGKLVGICETPASKGFTVHTPTAMIRDIGTRFGVTIDQDKSQFSVLEGSIAARAVDASKPEWIELREGEHAAIAQGSDDLVRLERSPVPYVYDWSAVAAQPRVTGQARFQSAMPMSLVPGDLERDLPVVFAERFGVKLPAGFEVTIDSPGEYDHLTLADPVALVAETAADCYFVHFDVPGEPVDALRRAATLHFDRPIVGVITTPDHLLASGHLLDRPDVRYRNEQVPENAPPVEGLDVTPTNPDIIRISEDRKTLTFDIATGPFTDQFRVLVQADTGVRHR